MAKKILIYFLVIFVSTTYVTKLHAKALSDTIRVLSIGNSFSHDAVEQYLYELGCDKGYTFIIGNMYIAGCSIERHLSCARFDAPDYNYRKIGPVDNKKHERKRVSLKQAIKDEPWDYISFQQVSQLSGKYDTYEESLPELFSYVDSLVTNKKVEYLLHQTWAYESNTSHSGFKNYQSNQLKMYRSIVDAVNKASKLVGISKIVPVGTAIQNARTSFIGDHMTRDGYHLNESYGRYTAACTWFEFLTGEDVTKVSYLPHNMHESYKTVATLAAHSAVQNPNQISDLGYVKQSDNKEEKIFRLSTLTTDLVLEVAPNGRLYQTYFGEKLINSSDLEKFSWKVYNGSDGSAPERGYEVVSGSGNADYYEPVLSIIHNDGNASTILKFISHQEKVIDGGVEHIFHLVDEQYPVTVELHYAVYPQQNIYKQWNVIKHQEKKPIILDRYASSIIYFNENEYYLHNYNSDWAKEMQLNQQQLTAGKKVVDTKLGSRACLVMDPVFEVGFNRPISENEGTVLLGTLGWTGNFSFTFEVDHVGDLRVISSINPYASSYRLKPNEEFVTPEFIYTLSQKGVGKGSRDIHQWALNYTLKDGDKERMTLLNNWENTYFKFDQNKLSQLMKEAQKLGVDMFLLDDGWFGNGAHARTNDRAGLGDWEVNKEKLPDGIPALINSAQDAGVKFGIWIEPEMVNPQSNLFEKHPEWAIHYPNREIYLYRNQLVLDLSNPKVQDYVFGVVDNIARSNPDIAYFKWDCNSPITNIYSPYLKDNQSQLYIDHIRGLYKVLNRVKSKYPHISMMLCSGGGGRCDYEALKYFTEFWCSDNTDPIERIYIQWNFSKFFPVKAMCSHVTSWNKQTGVKFRTDVASMCKLGFDLGLKDLCEEELMFCQEAIGNWKRLQKTVLEGDLYRLVSPYTSNHMALNYVNSNKDKAVLFAYDLSPRFKELTHPVKLQGLDAKKRYRIKEINLMPNTSSNLRYNGSVLTGDYLMKVGLQVFGSKPYQSKVIEITAE